MCPLSFAGRGMGEICLVNFLVRRFIKDYENTSDRTVRDRYGNLGCIVGIICNIFLFALKLSIGVISGSMAIMADAFNNLSDMGSSVVVMFGFKLAAKPADPEHPFGHGRMEYMSGFIVSMVIIIVGIELLKSSFDKIMSPEDMSVSLGIIIALILSVGVKLWMYFFNRRLGGMIDSAALKATAADSLSDCAATGAVILSVVIHRMFAINIDAYVGFVVAGFIIYNGINTARDTMNPLLGMPPPKELVSEIKRQVMEYDGFVGIHDLIVHNYGPGRIFASVHVEVPADIDIIWCHEQIDACEKEVGGALGIQLLIHMDPIATDDEEINEVRMKLARSIQTIDDRLTIHDFRMVKGEMRSNLIFDIVLPPGFDGTKEEMDGKIDSVAKKIDPTYFCVITYDIDLA